MKNTIYLARALAQRTKNRSQISLPAANMAERVSRVHAAPGGNKAQRAASGGGGGGGGSLSMLVPRRPEHCHNLPSLISNTQTPANPPPSSPPHIPALHPANPSRPCPPRRCSVLTAGASRSHISGNFLKCHSSLSDWMAPGSNAAHADTLFPPRPVCPVPTRLLSPPLRRHAAKSLRPCMILSFCLFLPPTAA